MKGMKGVELPINILVIVAVAVVVLLGIVALYFVGWSPFPKTVGLESAKNDACRQLVQEGRCQISSDDVEISGFDADKDGYTSLQESDEIGPDIVGTCANAVQDNMDDNLFNLCRCWYNMGPAGSILTDAEIGQVQSSCRRMCGCP